MTKSKPELIMLRGLIGAGKTTYAKKLMDEMPDKFIRINKEELRRMMFFGDEKNCKAGGLVYWHGKHAKFGKSVVSMVIKQAFKSGYSVIADGANLTDRHERFFRDIARNRARFMIVEISTPLDECIRRNESRERPVRLENLIRLSKVIN